VLAQTIAAKQEEGIDSLRIDIPKDMVPPTFRRGERKFFDMDAPEHASDEPALKFINEVWKR
jgi:hypothetical protein